MTTKQKLMYAVFFGQKHPSFSYDDFKHLQALRRLAAKHQRQCTNDCNGYGVVNGQMYYTGQIDDYARREYGASVKTGYVAEDTTVFHAEIERLEDKINTLNQAWPKFKIEYQHDPRGNTVKVYYDNDFIDFDL